PASTRRPGPPPAPPRTRRALAAAPRVRAHGAFGSSVRRTRLPSISVRATPVPAIPEARLAPPFGRLAKGLRAPSFPRLQYPYQVQSIDDPPNEQGARRARNQRHD